MDELGSGFSGFFVLTSPLERYSEAFEGLAVDREIAALPELQRLPEALFGIFDLVEVELESTERSQGEVATAVVLVQGVLEGQPGAFAAALSHVNLTEETPNLSAAAVGRDLILDPPLRIVGAAVLEADLGELDADEVSTRRPLGVERFSVRPLGVVELAEGLADLSGEEELVERREVVRFAVLSQALEGELTRALQVAQVERRPRASVERLDVVLEEVVPSGPGLLVEIAVNLDSFEESSQRGPVSPVHDLGLEGAQPVEVLDLDHVEAERCLHPMSEGLLVGLPIAAFGAPAVPLETGVVIEVCKRRRATRRGLDLIRSREQSHGAVRLSKLTEREGDLVCDLEPLLGELPRQRFGKLGDPFPVELLLERLDPTDDLPWTLDFDGCCCAHVRSLPLLKRRSPVVFSDTSPNGYGYVDVDGYGRRNEVDVDVDVGIEIHRLKCPKSALSSVCIPGYTREDAMPVYWKEDPVKWVSIGYELEFDTLFGAYLDDVVNVLEQEYGAEKISRYDWNHKSTGDTWDIKIDGSAGREDYGWEIASPKFSVPELYECLEAIRIINSFSSDADIWRGCGFHVHFGLSSVDRQLGKTFITFMVYFQHAFLTFMPLSRKGNRYAQCNDYQRVRHGLGSYVAEARKDADRERYRLVNLTRYSPSQGHRLELRHHSGTREPEKAYLWIRTLLASLKASANWKAPGKGDGTFQELHDLIARVDPYAARWARDRREYFMQDWPNHGFIDNLPFIDHSGTDLRQFDSEQLMLVTALGKGGTCTATELNRKVEEVSAVKHKRNILSIQRNGMIERGLLERVGGSNSLRLTPFGENVAVSLLNEGELELPLFDSPEPAEVEQSELFPSSETMQFDWDD